MNEDNPENNMSEDNAEKNMSQDNPGENMSQDNPGENMSQDNPGENMSQDNPGENMSQDNPEKNMSEDNPLKRKRGRKMLSEDDRWSDRELLKFARAVQRYGSRDTANIALAVKTKTEKDVKAFIAREVNKHRTKIYKGTGERRQSIRTVRADQQKVEGWSTARKWMMIAQNQMLHCLRKNEYSGILLPQLWEQFRDEQAPPDCPEAINVKAIYAYVADCMNGHPPPELPPKEAAIILMLFRLMREMRDEMDPHEEMAFIKNFKKATTFVPFRVKDEFLKDKDEVVAEEDCVPIPEEVFCGLNRHKKMVQSFNPLSVPLWLLQKQQDFLAHMFDDAMDLDAE